MGYPIDQCCLPDDQKEELKCELCLDILENPKTLVPCGHAFCEEHIEEISVCPGSIKFYS